MCAELHITSHYMLSLYVRPAVPSQQGCALLCASAEASAGPASHDGEADPASAALTGPPRMPNGTEARNTTARMGAERSWSRHKDLNAERRDERITEDVKRRKQRRRDVGVTRKHHPCHNNWQRIALRYTDTQMRYKWSPDSHRIQSELQQTVKQERKRLYSLSLVETGRIRLVLELRFLMAIVSWET